MQINDINIYNSCKSLSAKLMEPNKYEHLCISYKQSRHWKHVDVTFKDNPQGFFLGTPTSFLWNVNHTAQSTWPSRFWLIYTWCFCVRHGTAGPSGCVYTAEQKRLPMKSSLSAVCITYLLEHPQGQLRGEFPGTPLRGKPWEWFSTLQYPL